MREPSTPCTLEHPTGSDRRTSTFAEPLARRSDAQNPLSATARLRSRLLIARAVPRIPQEPHTDHHTRPKNNACEKCGLESLHKINHKRQPSEGGYSEM